MTIEELNEAIGNNKMVSTQVPASEISNIMKYVNVSLEMDGKSLDYYYNIVVSELLESETPKSFLEDFKNTGWAFDKTKKNIRIYIKH